MMCPHCKNTVSAFSTKCQWCTGEYTLGHLWKVNILAYTFATVVFVLFFAWVIAKYGS